MLDQRRRRSPKNKPRLGQCILLLGCTHPENRPSITRRALYIGLMLGHRRRRWPNIKPTPAQCIMFV